MRNHCKSTRIAPDASPVLLGRPYPSANSKAPAAFGDAWGLRPGTPGDENPIYYTAEIAQNLGPKISVK